MPSLQMIESQVATFPEPEIWLFRSWFEKIDAQNLERTLVTDISNCKLDTLAAETLAYYGAGQCKPLWTT